MSQGNNTKLIVALLMVGAVASYIFNQKKKETYKIPYDDFDGDNFENLSGEEQELLKSYTIKDIEPGASQEDISYGDPTPPLPEGEAMGEIINFNINNSTDADIPIVSVLGNNQDRMDNSNATTSYVWDLTSFSFTNETNVLINYKWSDAPSSAPYQQATTPILEQTYRGLVNALNTLELGSFFTSNTPIYGTTIVNSNFNVGSGTNGTGATCFAKQSDGKIVMGGAFSTYNGASAIRLIRLNTDGSLDTTFNCSAFGSSATVIQNIAIATDGTIYVVGLLSAYNHIVALNSDGSIKASFVVGSGFTPVGLNATTSIALQSDGKLIVVGSFSAYQGNACNGIVRINTNGSYDSSFVTGSGFNNGSVSTMDVKINSSGVIWVVGQFTLYNATQSNYIIALNSSGGIVTSYGVGQGFNSSPLQLILDSSNNIFICGGFLTFNGFSVANVIKLTSVGAYDNTFTLTSTFASGTPSDMAIQSDGKLIVCGNFTSYNSNGVGGIVKFNADGSENNGSTYGSGFDTTVRAVIILNDGTIVLGGLFTTFNATTYNHILGLYANDTPIVIGQNTFLNNYNLNVVFGELTIYSNNNPTTIINPTFVQGSGFNTFTNYIKPQSDGKLVVVGDFATYQGVTYNKIIRLNIGGSVDTTFNVGSGIGGGYPFSLLIQSDGKILVGGTFTSYNGNACNNIVRINTDGSFDSTFIQGTGFNGTVLSMAQQSDGKVLFGGNFNTYNNGSPNAYGIVRLNTDGTIDPTFVSGSGFNYASGGITCILVQSDGKIVIGGDFTTYQGVSAIRIVRVNSNGSRDSSFVVTTGFTGAYGTNAPYSIVAQSDGKLIVGGAFSGYNGSTAQSLVRINTNGSYDSTYNTTIGFNNALYNMIIDTSGRVYCGGIFTTYNNSSSNYIARVNANGTFDTTWDIGTGFGVGSPNSICLDNSSLYVTGGFTSFDGVSILGYITSLLT